MLQSPPFADDIDRLTRQDSPVHGGGGGPHFLGKISVAAGRGDRSALDHAPHRYHIEQIALSSNGEGRQ